MENHDNQELHRIFARQKSFYREMESVSRKYLQFQQQVYYLPIKDINPEMIIKLEGANYLKNNALRKKEDIYIINGQYQPVGEKSFQRLILQLVQTIPRPKTAFGVVYINTLAESEAYNDFKKVLELLPIEYLVNLTKIYVLNASFFNKAFSWLSFGTAISYINKKTINVDNLKELSQESHIEINLFKQRLPKNVLNVLVKPQNSPRRQGGICVQEYDANDISKSTKRQQIQTHFAIGNMNRTKSADNQFPSQPNKLHSSNKKELTDYEIGPTGAPIIIEMLICFFNKKEDYLKRQGLFRKSVSIEDEAIILQELNNKNYNYLETVTDPHLIANAIKRFLGSLKTPIIPYQMFDEFMEKEADPHFNAIVVERIKQLPKINRMVIFLLFDFLANSVVPYSEWSKMGVNNLCIVFGPCLMRSQTASIKDLIYAKKIIVATNIIFKQFQGIFGDKNSQMRLKRNSYKEYRIEENKQRESRELKQSPNKLKQPLSVSEESSNEEKYQQCKTPTFRVHALLNKTSLFIRQALSKEQSDDDFDEIEDEGPIQKPSVAISKDFSYKQLEKEEKKVAQVNLFITPSVSQEKAIGKDNRSVEIISSNFSKESEPLVRKGEEIEHSNA